jgi:hypothetical protein
MDCMSTRSLLITNVTPAVALGVRSLSELIIWSLLWKISWILEVRGLSRCVSCSAKIPILSFFSVELISDHFSYVFLFSLPTWRPFIFSEAILIFALFLIPFLGGVREGPVGFRGEWLFAAWVLGWLSSFVICRGVGLRWLRFVPSSL